MVQWVNHRLLKVSSQSVQLLINTHRGLTIDQLSFMGEQALIGTIPHGFYDNMGLSADWYSGNTVLQQPGKPQVTDLSQLESIEIFLRQEDDTLCIRAKVESSLGPIHKEIRIYHKEARLEVKIKFDWEELPIGSCKTGILTFLPGAWDISSLSYSTHNGGTQLETFQLDKSVNHAAPSSSVVSASHVLGATEGFVSIQDKYKQIQVRLQRSQNGALPMIQHCINSGHTPLTRLLFSWGEVDEGRKVFELNSKELAFDISYHQL